MKTKNLKFGYAIVLGCAHFNALGVIRSLGESGIPSVFVNQDTWSSAAYSRYTLRTYQASNAKKLCEAILDSVQTFGGKPTVFPCSDFFVSLLDSIRDDLSDLVILPQFNRPSDYYLSKDVMCKFAEQSGFHVPRTKRIENDTIDVSAEIVSFGFPCILKPLSGVKGNKADIRVIHRPEDIEQALSAFAGYRVFLLQEFIHGSENHMVDYSGCKSPGKPVDVFGEVRKIREYPIEGGSSSYMHISPEILHLDKKALDCFLESIGYSGVFDLDFLVADGIPYFIEIKYQKEVMSIDIDTSSQVHVIAVAYDEAFCFYYRQNLRLFERAGLKLEFFSPLHDQQIPKAACGLILGGGYPELYLESLSKNASMLKSVKDAIDSGMPTIAECGGYMYLHSLVRDRQGNPFSLVGVLDGECSYTGHLVRFGYMQVCDEQAKAFNTEIKGMRGHEFHYYDSTVPCDHLVKKPVSCAEWNAIICDERKLWGYPHFYYGSCSKIVNGFTEAAKDYSNGK